MTKLAGAFEQGVARAVHWSVQRRKTVIAATWLAALLCVPGVLQLEVHNRMTEWVDPDDAAPAAFLDGVEQLEGLVNFERTLLFYEGSDSEGLLSLDSLREQERLTDTVFAAVPELTGQFSAMRMVQLAQYEIERARGDANPQDRLPASDTELQLALDAARQNQGDIFDYTLSADRRTGYIGFNFEAEPFSVEATFVGADIADAIQAAYDRGFNTLAPEGTEPVGVATVSAHVNDILRRDMVLLGGLGIGLVFILFWFSAGRPAAVIGGFSSLGLGLVITVGIVGWLGIPFNILNFAILPLVMGNGIDYAIHVLAESRGDKYGQGLGRRLGRSLGAPIILVTLTTCVGLATLGFSGSPYLRQMGILAASSILLIAVMSLTYLPAWLATFGGSVPAPKQSRVFGASLATAKRAPWALWGVVFLLSAGGLAAFATIDYEVDLLSGSLPDDDPLIVAQDRFEAAFNTEDAWFLLLRGDVVSDASFAFQERFLEQLRQRGAIEETDAAFSLPTIANGHHQQRQPAAGLLPVLGVPDATTAEEKVAAMEAEAPYEQVLRPLLSRDHTVGAFYVLPIGEGRQVDATDAVRQDYEAAAVAANPPDGLDVKVYSFKLLARDFMGESQTSLQVLYVVSLASTLLLFYGVTRDARATAIVALPVLLSSLWWFGLLKLTLGSIGVYQLISLVFITSIGSDYAAYLVYKHRDTGSLRETLGVTGRAVTFSALTDAGAFLVFSTTAVRSGGQMLLGAALAIVAIFAATWAVVPALLRAKGEGEKREA